MVEHTSHRPIDRRAQIERSLDKMCPGLNLDANGQPPLKRGPNGRSIEQLYEEARFLVILATLLLVFVSVNNTIGKPSLSTVVT